MENTDEIPPKPPEAGSIPVGTLRWLNLLGDIAHVAVAVLLIVMTALVLVYACFSYAPHLAFMADALRSKPPPNGPHPADPFISSSVEFLSNILFAVILLEVLHTTIVFLHDRSSRAIVRAFLVVAILSIVRKLLLVGAESSLTGEMGLAFIYSSAGTLVSIIGILMLSGALVYISRMSKEPD